MSTNKKKVALITGANKGIGKEIARQLGLLGITVILTARDPKAGAKAVEELVAAGCEAYTVALDVTNASDITNLASYIEREFGKLDILVNNAGIAIEWDGQPTNAEKIRRTLETNLIAPFAITEALIPMLSLSEDARVINHSSQLGSINAAETMWQYISEFMTVGYATSKAGLNMLTQIQSKSLENKGIAVAAAHPGWVKTDLGSDAAPMEVEEGASTVVSLATVSREQFPHGQLVHKGSRIPW